MRLMVSARSWRASLEASGAAASASWSARASRKAARASADLPVSYRSQPICDRQAASAARADGSAPAGPASSDSDRR